ncbi:cell division protein FtsX [Maridesulfovibrio bastinii]|uniref:cell division protein FtsX n=1 Tax=Maridesulfovibrio bastinii TaxID=47157 RepID=UPI0004039099|nr:permease-like cell division protein FtsX [Maridesulfovibrio bastinii]
MFILFFRLVGRGIRDLGLHPWANIFTLIAVTMVSLLAGFFMLALQNINQELLKTRGEVQFQIFWKASTPEDVYVSEWEKLSNIEGLKEIHTFTPQNALTQLSSALGGGENFSYLDKDNPLPPTALLSFSVEPGAGDENWASDLLSELKAMNGVDKVHYNPIQIDLARGWLNLTKTIVWPVIMFLGLVVALVVGNTMRLSLMTRKDEIEILYLVGAKQWFIRIPILTGGAVQGFLGGTLAVGILYMAQQFFRDILNFPPLFLKIGFLPLDQCAMLVGVVAVVGIISSYVAVR